MQQLISANIYKLPAPTNTIPSHQLPVLLKDKLTIIQWNADEIRPKLFELRNRFINTDIHVVAIQESKLHKADKTPSIEGYCTNRKDRNNILGSGLLFSVRSDVIFEKLHSFKQTGMEILSMWVCTSKSLWTEVYNIYIPYTTIEQIHFDPNHVHPKSLFHSKNLGCDTSRY